MSDSGNGRGGGIDSSGALTLTNSTFSGNFTTVSVVGGYGYGGGVNNSGTASVANSTFGDNAAKGGFSGYGGGINNSGKLSLSSSTFMDNLATGITANGAPAISDYGYGGGVNNSGTLTLTNSTFVSNAATAGLGSFGGALADSGTVSVSYVTADDNSAATGGGVAITAGAQSAVDSIDSIFQNTQGGNVTIAAGGFRSMGHNIFSDTPSITLDPTDLVNTDPKLGLLADNSGPTFTQAPLTGSPALNGGISVAGITTDQRGGLRPSSGPTDVGAFQVQPPLTVVSLVRQGTHKQPNVLVLTFNLPLDAVAAGSLANYQLVRTADGKVIPIGSAQYDAASQSVILLPKPKLPATQTYTLTVIGLPPGGLTTSLGAYLAGAGQPGTNYVASIN
jgi:hypothetical protein